MPLMIETSTTGTGCRYETAEKMYIPELHGLVDFLQSDDRPSAVFRTADKSNGWSPEPELLFQNAAFEALEFLEGDLQKVLKIVQKQQANGGEAQEKSHKSRTLLIEGKSWSARAGGSGCTVLVFQGETNQQDISTGGIPPQQQSQPVQAASHDWTRHAVADLHPWIEHVRTFDWAGTGLGSIHTWSESLRQTMLMVMSNPNPRLLVWGEGKTFIYNHACAPLWGDKHPACLGKPVSVVWAEIWEHIRPMIEAGYAGQVRQMKGMPLVIDRHGFMEETYWDFAIIPVTDGDGKIQGIVDEISDSTETKTGERRRNSVAKLTERISCVKSLPELWPSFCRGLEHAGEDIPYVLLYSVADRAHHHLPDPHAPDSPGLHFVLEASLGIDSSSADICKVFGLDSHNTTGSCQSMIEPCLQAFNTRKPILLTVKDGTLPPSLQVSVPERAFGGQIDAAVITPLITPGGEPLGILLLGLTPRCPWNEEFQLYVDIITDVLRKAASLIAVPAEQRRTQKIADDMNVELSHQLRLITREAERSQARFSRMASSAPFGMFVFDPEGRPLHVNDAYLTMTGQTREEFNARVAVSATWEDRIHPDDVAQIAAQWTRVQQEKVPITIEYRLQKPWVPNDSSAGPDMRGETWLLANAFPDINTDGEIMSIQGWLTDISHRKFSEHLLARKLEDALENKRQTENFIDMTSHEMRNPLSAILQSADSIVSSLKSIDGGAAAGGNNNVFNSGMAHEIADAAQTIILCAQHQKRIVDDILTLSKLDASLLVISPDASHPPTLIYKALKMYEAEMTRSNVRATLILEPSYEQLGIDWVVLDASRLLQVVINLLTNAIKFTQFSEKREIVVTVSASYEKPSGSQHGVEFIPPRHTRQNPTLLEEWGKGEEIYLQVAVSDTGRGLNSEDMQLLFRRFSQASPKTYGQYGGSGLGLFISRELCELQGGQIGVSSSDGKTTFTFFVRAKKSVPNGPPAEIQRSGIPAFLTFANSPIVFHRRGSVAIEGSIEVGRDSSKAQEVRVPTRTKSDEAKPLARHAAAATEQDASDLHVLIVEDNLINQKVMSQQLRRAGCTVHIANHGQECLDFLQRTSFHDSASAGSSPRSPFSPQQPSTPADEPTTPLSVILLDLEMPTMDGLTCIREIRRMQMVGEIGSHVPVIAVTANARSEQIAVALDAGMDSVVTKPFRIPELVPQMHALVADVAARKAGGPG